MLEVDKGIQLLAHGITPSTELLEAITSVVERSSSTTEKSASSTATVEHSDSPYSIIRIFVIIDVVRSIN